jgi:hypothetical protein
LQARWRVSLRVGKPDTFLRPSRSPCNDRAPWIVYERASSGIIGGVRGFAALED